LGGRALARHLCRATPLQRVACPPLFVQPAECFKEAHFGGVKIYALKPRDDEGRVVSEDALRLQSWQEAAFDALDKRYLRSVVLSIFTGEEEPSQRDLLES
jgi:hypothetical protein